MAAQVQDCVCDGYSTQNNTVIVTGFGPFGAHKINASWESVKLLKDTDIEKELGIHLVTEQVPVVYSCVEKQVPKLWETYKPLLVVHVGVSDLAGCLTIEKCAAKTGYTKIDVWGSTPEKGECCIGDKEKIQCALNVNKVTEEINKKASCIRVCTSTFAGLYLCEYTYYTSLSIDPGRTVFVHVPVLNRPYSAQQIAEGLAEIIALLVEQLRTANNNHKENYLQLEKNEL